MPIDCWNLPTFFLIDERVKGAECGLKGMKVSNLTPHPNIALFAPAFTELHSLGMEAPRVFLKYLGDKYLLEPNADSVWA